MRQPLTCSRVAYGVDAARMSRALKLNIHTVHDDSGAKQGLPIDLGYVAGNPPRRLDDGLRLHRSHFNPGHSVTGVLEHAEVGHRRLRSVIPRTRPSEVASAGVRPRPDNILATTPMTCRPQLRRAKASKAPRIPFFLILVPN